MLTPRIKVAVLQAAFSASLVYLFVALFVVHPTSRFGLAQTILALIASIGSGRALMLAKKEVGT